MTAPPYDVILNYSRKSHAVIENSQNANDNDWEEGGAGVDDGGKKRPDIHK